MFYAHIASSALDEYDVYEVAGTVPTVTKHRQSHPGRVEDLNQLSVKLGKLLLCAALVLWVLPTNASAQALVQNGDFSVAFGAGGLAWVPTATAPSSVAWTGSSAIFVSNVIGGGSAATSLSQTGVTPLDTTHFFELAFTLSGLASAGGAPTFAVTYNAVTVFSGPAANGSFSTGAFAITNGTGPLVFTFTGGGIFDTITLDSVVLTDLGVPEIDPSSAAAPVALCIGGVFWAMDRRKRFLSCTD